MQSQEVAASKRKAKGDPQHFLERVQQDIEQKKLKLDFLRQ